MSVAVVINTCSMQPGALGHIGPSGQPYGLRAKLLKEHTIPFLKAQPWVASITVAGEFEPGEDYAYVPIQSVYRNCRDVLAQREAGYNRARSTAKWFLFMMDDHCPAEGWGEVLPRYCETSHDRVVSPLRVDRSGQALNSGWNGVGFQDEHGPYLHTHGVLMSQGAVARSPWARLTPIYRFDLLHTMWWQDLDIEMFTSHTLKLVDME